MASGTLKRPVAMIAVLILVTTSAATTASAQGPGPCVNGKRDVDEALKDLGKDIFFKAMEMGGEGIGVRARDQIADGLIRGNQGQVAAGRTLARQGSVLAKSAKFIDGVDSVLLEPLKEYIDSPGPDAASKAFQKFFENTSKLAMESAAERAEIAAFGTGIGFAVIGGKIFVGTATFTAQEMISEVERQKAEALVFGGGPDLVLGNMDNPFAKDPFFEASVITRAKGLTPANIGLRVKSEDDLRKIWYTDYQLHLNRGFAKLAPNALKQALDDGWPIIQKYWARQRAQAIIDRAQTAFEGMLPDMERQAADGKLGDCTPEPKPTPSLAKPVKGAFGPAQATFGHYPPKFENHEFKVSGTVGPRSVNMSLEKKPASDGITAVSHTYTGNLPEILKPGDIVDLGCTSTGSVSGKWPPNIGGSCFWEVEGSATVLESTKGTFVGMGGGGPSTSGTHKLKFRVGTGGRLVVRAVNFGYNWGDSPDRNPATYVYTFVP